MAKFSAFEIVCRNYFSSFEESRLSNNFTNDSDVNLKFTFGVFSYECEFFYTKLSDSLKSVCVYITVYKNGIYMRNHYFKFYSRNYIDKNFSCYINNVFDIED